MKSQMNWGNDSPYEYKFDRGLYYHEVYTGVYVGTQPRHVQDVCERECRPALQDANFFLTLWLRLGSSL